MFWKAALIFIISAMQWGCATKSDEEWEAEQKTRRQKYVVSRAAADARAAVTRGDFTFYAVQGYAVTVPGVEDLVANRTVDSCRVIEGTSDAHGLGGSRWQRHATAYAAKYNRVIAKTLAERAEVAAFKRYYYMARYIDRTTLPVMLSYEGLRKGSYVMAVQTNLRSWPAFLGGEEVTLLYEVQAREGVARKAGYAWPAMPVIPLRDRKTMGKDRSLDEIYRIWMSLKIPLPVLKAATLENWHIGPESVLWPAKVRKYNALLESPGVSNN